MARYTTAYSSLISRLNEVHLLRRLASAREKTDPITLRNEINVFCRAAIVLLCAHLEAYIKELGEVALTGIELKAVPRSEIASQFYYHISKDVLNDLKNTSQPDRIAEKLFLFLSDDLPYWDRNGPFPQPLPVERFNKGFSNPGFDKIRAYFNRFGYGQYQGDLGGVLRANYNVTVNMVDHLVDTRNKIAHGDLSVTKTPSDVEQMINIIRSYCGATDSVFAAWFKSKYCPIR
jgi:hypothetical protein